MQVDEKQFMLTYSKIRDIEIPENLKSALSKLLLTAFMPATVGKYYYTTVDNEDFYLEDYLYELIDNFILINDNNLRLMNIPGLWYEIITSISSCSPLKENLEEFKATLKDFDSIYESMKKTLSEPMESIFRDDYRKRRIV